MGVVNLYKQLKAEHQPAVHCFLEFSHCGHEIADVFC
jgi:hypothetical protein